MWFSLVPAYRLAAYCQMRNPFHRVIVSAAEGDLGQVKMTWPLRSHAPMPLAWIAERLSVGTRGHLAWLLQRRGRNQLTTPWTDGCWK